MASGEPTSEPNDVVGLSAQQRLLHIHGALDLTVHPWLECCGVRMAVRERWLSVARQNRFYHVSKPFKRVYYRALAARKVVFTDAHEALKMISRHKTHLRLNVNQVWGIYGLECGVFDVTGRFMPEFGDLASSGRGVAVGDWPLIREEAIQVAAGLPDRADVKEEFRWIDSRMFEWPDFTTAPSRTAVKQWLALNDPVNPDPALYREFFKVSMSKRLTPGDASGKLKAATFEEDEDGTDETAEREEYQRRLGRRLFGEAG